MSKANKYKLGRFSFLASAIALYVLFFMFIVIILSACAPRVEYKQVLIPTKCEIQMPTRPTFSDSFAPYNIRDLLIYTQELESALKFCTKND